MRLGKIEATKNPLTINKRAKTQMMKKIINALLHLQYNFRYKNRTNFIINNKKDYFFFTKVYFFDYCQKYSKNIIFYI